MNPWLEATESNIRFNVTGILGSKNSDTGVSLSALAPFSQGTSMGATFNVWGSPFYLYHSNIKAVITEWNLIYPNSL